jgi:dipeptidyl aminopeptidase/acylaminoacyl peptidase
MFPDPAANLRHPHQEVRPGGPRQLRAPLSSVAHYRIFSTDMKTPLSLFVLCLLGFTAHAQIMPGDNLTVTGIPPIPRQLVDRTGQYLNARAASFADWEAQGRGIFILTRFANTAQVHLVSMPGGARQQRTFFEEPVSGVVTDPRPGRSGFTFTRDVGGAEFYQVYYFDAASGTATLWTGGKSRNSNVRWSHRMDRVVFTSNRRNGRDTDICLMTADHPESARALTTWEGSWSATSWSPDDASLLVNKFISANRSRLWIMDIATAVLRSIEADTTKEVSYGDATWSRDGRTIYYVSNETGEFTHLMSYDLRSGRRMDMTPGLLWDIENMELSDDGSWMAYAANEDGISRLHVLRLPSRQEMPVSGMPVGVLGGLGFSPDSKRLAFSITGSDSPGDAYVLDMGSRSVKRWTFSEVGGLNPASFVTPRLIRYPTFDSSANKPRMIPAFIHHPAKASGKTPVIINIHGGPEGQSRPTFSSTTQYYVNELGCAVISPNVRGSTGYGKSYLAADDGYHRELSVQDIGALLDWIATQPDLDPARVAVMGGSYGGYMVLACLTHFPDRIRCGIDVVGISNFVTFLENTQEYRRDLRRVEYGDERDPAMRSFLQRISPTTNADRIRSALFVAQGENDPRVPAGEARQIANVVSKNGVAVWSLFAKDEGHGFAKKNNRDYFTWSTILFLEKFLLGR